MQHKRGGKKNKKHTENCAVQAKRTRSENVLMMHNLPLVWIIFTCGYFSNCISGTFCSHYLYFSFFQTLRKDQYSFMAFISSFFLLLIFKFYFFNKNKSQQNINLALSNREVSNCCDGISKEAVKTFIKSTTTGLWFRGCRVNFQHLLSADEII